MDHKNAFPLLAVFALALAVAASAQAQDAPASDTPPYTVTGNLALTPDYLFRGLTQTFAAHTDIPRQLTTPLANGASNPSYSDFGATLKWQFATHETRAWASLTRTTTLFMTTRPVSETSTTRVMSAARVAS